MKICIKTHPDDQRTILCSDAVFIICQYNEKYSMTPNGDSPTPDDFSFINVTSVTVLSEWNAMWSRSSKRSICRAEISNTVGHTKNTKIQCKRKKRDRRLLSHILISSNVFGEKDFLKINAKTTAYIYKMSIGSSI